MLSSCKGEGTRKKAKCLILIGGGSNSLSVSGLETKRTNSGNMSRLIPVAESEAKFFSSETRDYYQWIRYCYGSHNIFLWWSCGYYHWIRYNYRSRKIVLRWSCDYCSIRLHLRTRSKFSLTSLYSPYSKHLVEN